MLQIKKALTIIILIISGCSGNDERSCRSNTCISLTDSGFAGSGGTGIAGSGGTSGTGGAGGTSVTGGAGGSGGSGSTDGGSAGDSGTGDSGNINPNGYTFNPCPGVTPTKPVGLDNVPVCYFPGFAGTGHHIPEHMIGDLRNGILRFAGINPSNGACIPDAITYVNGDMVLKDCSAGKGKCYPDAFLQYPPALGDSQDCSDIESCVLCVDPNTGESTNACNDLC